MYAGCCVAFIFLDAETTMKLTRLTTLTSFASFAVSVLLPGVSVAAGGSISGQAALAMAGVVAPYSPLPAAEKKAVAAFFAGKTNVPYTKKITVTADKIVCRTSNVDITARSCELTFGTSTKKFTGREANEVYSTEAMAGIPPDGAAGSNFESISKLNCTLDPAQLKDKAGAGAECSYQPAN
jgi:hypothetical protein